MLQKLKNYVLGHKKALFSALFILTLGIIYLFLFRYTSFRIHCIFRKLTGLACPGCGITTLVNRLANFDFLRAFSENYAVTFLVPYFGIIYLFKLTLKPKCLQNNGWLYNSLVLAALITVILFGIIRNLPGMEFLLPSYMR